MSEQTTPIEMTAADLQHIVEALNVFVRAQSDTIRASVEVFHLRQKCEEGLIAIREQKSEPQQSTTERPRRSRGK